jgi:hypothetical protein
MSEDSMLMCLIAFVLGYLVGRMMRGNGLRVGGQDDEQSCPDICLESIDNNTKFINVNTKSIMDNSSFMKQISTTLREVFETK